MTWLEEERDFLRQRLRAVESLLQEKDWWRQLATDRSTDDRDDLQQQLTLQRQVAQVYVNEESLNTTRLIEFIEHTMHNYAEDLPLQWLAHARTLLASLEENADSAA